MTAPVTLSWVDNDYTMRFFVPSSFGSEVPKPTASDVTIEQVRSNIVAVISFGGCESNFQSIII